MKRKVVEKSGEFPWPVPSRTGFTAYNT